MKHLIPISVFVLLAACGGGGSDDSPPTTEQPPVVLDPAIQARLDADATQACGPQGTFLKRTLLAGPDIQPGVEVDFSPPIVPTQIVMQLTCNSGTQHFFTYQLDGVPKQHVVLPQ